MTSILSAERSVQRSGVAAVTALGATFLLLSAVLQVVASLERWVVARGGDESTDMSIEDHRFDYIVPAEPWENVGAAAQWFGAGSLALAAGVVLLGLAGSRSAVRIALVVLAAGPFALAGIHAFASGLLGIPSALVVVVSSLLSLGVQVIAVVALGVHTMRESRLRGLALVLVAGSTIAGLLVATFVIAPMIAGYQSYDTTPWSETVVAVWTAVPGIVAVAAAVAAARRRPVENPDPA